MSLRLVSRTWYKEGSYIPYTEKDPKLLTELLARVKARLSCRLQSI